MTLISKPDHPWELHGKVPLQWQKNTGEPPFLRINEGREFLEHPGPDDGCGSNRAPNMQKFDLTKSGIPHFGEPVGRRPLALPSGNK